jgi:hypothetical protein
VAEPHPSRPSTEAEHRFKERRGIAALFVGLLGGPVLALGTLHLTYAVVPRACRTGAELPLHLIMGLTVALAVGTLWLAWRDWRIAGASWPGEEGGMIGRSRFLAALGVLLSAFFALVVLAMWAPIFVLGPCQGS